MDYTKPAIQILGRAETLIETNSVIKGPTHLDGNGSGQLNAVAAYDLDE